MHDRNIFPSRGCPFPLLELWCGCLETAMGGKRKSLPGEGRQAKSGKVEKAAVCPTTQALSQWLLDSPVAMSFGEALQLSTWQPKRLCCDH